MRETSISSSDTTPIGLPRDNMRKLYASRLVRPPKQEPYLFYDAIDDVPKRLQNQFDNGDINDNVLFLLIDVTRLLIKRAYTVPISILKFLREVLDDQPQDGQRVTRLMFRHEEELQAYLKQRTLRKAAETRRKIGRPWQIVGKTGAGLPLPQPDWLAAYEQTSIRPHSGQQSELNTALDELFPNLPSVSSLQASKAVSEALDKLWQVPAIYTKALRPDPVEIATATLSDGQLILSDLLPEVAASAECEIDETISSETPESPERQSQPIAEIPEIGVQEAELQEQIEIHDGKLRVRYVPIAETTGPELFSVTTDDTELYIDTEETVSCAEPPVEALPIEEGPSRTKSLMNNLQVFFQERFAPSPKAERFSEDLPLADLPEIGPDWLAEIVEAAQADVVQYPSVVMDSELESELLKSDEGFELALLVSEPETPAEVFEAHIVEPQESPTDTEVLAQVLAKVELPILEVEAPILEAEPPTLSDADLAPAPLELSEPIEAATIQAEIASETVESAADTTSEVALAPPVVEIAAPVAPVKQFASKPEVHIDSPILNKIYKTNQAMSEDVNGMIDRYFSSAEEESLDSYFELL